MLLDLRPSCSQFLISVWILIISFLALIFHHMLFLFFFFYICVIKINLFSALSSASGIIVFGACNLADYFSTWSICP